MKPRPPLLSLSLAWASLSLSLSSLGIVISGDTIILISLESGVDRGGLGLSRDLGSDHELVTSSRSSSSMDMMAPPLASTRDCPAGAIAPPGPPIAPPMISMLPLTFGQYFAARQINVCNFL